MFVVLDHVYGQLWPRRYTSWALREFAFECLMYVKPMNRIDMERIELWSDFIHGLVGYCGSTSDKCERL